jgi:ribose transport system permease protein
MSTTIARNQTSLRLQLTTIDALVLAGAAVMLIAFILLPWISEAGSDVTGLTLLTASTEPISQAVQDGLAATRLALLLIPIAALLAGGMVLWKASGQRRSTSFLIRLAGFISMAYYVLFWAQDRQYTEAALAQFAGGGYWLAFFVALFFLAQSYIVRQSSAATADQARAERTGGWLAGLRSRLASNARLVAITAFVFRFQSFFGLIIVFILAVVFSPVRNDANIFLSQRNLSNVTRDVAETGILAVGQMLVIIIGGIDLSVGSIVALTATGVAFLLMRDLVSAIPAIIIILSLGLLVGWWNGWTAERFKIPSFVTTLAMLSIARGIAHIWSSDIAVPISYGAGGADPLFGLIGERINGVFPVPAIIMFIVAFIMSLVLHYTAFGRYLYAIGGNQTAANLSGVAVTRIKIFAFMLCGFFASMAGVLHAAQLNQGSPNEAVGYELNAIAAVVIGGASLSGGKGTIIGAVAGAFILGILDNMLSLNNVNSNVQLVTKGLLVVAAVALQQLKPRSAE